MSHLFSCVMQLYNTEDNNKLNELNNNIQEMNKRLENTNENYNPVNFWTTKFSSHAIFTIKNPTYTVYFSIYPTVL